MTDRRQPDHRVGRAAGALLGRRRAWTAAALAGALLARPGGGVAQAQPGWPERPVRIVVPIAPGGPMDLIARSLAEKLFETWRQPVIVENRPGAATAIGTEHVARAAPDGYTLLLAAVAHVMNPPLLPRLPHDPVRDFTPILQVATQPMVLAVHPTVPAETLAAFVALARARGAAGQPLALGGAAAGARLGRGRRLQPPGGGAVRHHRGLRLHPRPLRRRGAAADRAARRRGAGRLPQLHRRHPAGPRGRRRAPARPGRDEHDALARAAGGPDRRRNGLAGLRGFRPGMASSPRRACRRRSSIACTATSPRRCACPTCGRG